MAYAARYTLKALDPVWFRGLGPAGNAWDPKVIHATAMNFALMAALGVNPIHRRFETLWVPHSLPYASLGVWISPAEVVEGTVVPKQVFRGGTHGEMVLTTLPAATEGHTGLTVGTAPDGRIMLTDRKVEHTGKPYATTAYMGEWSGMLFVDTLTDARNLFPDLGGETMVLRVGPAMSAMELVLSEFEEVDETDYDPDLLADHLVDPMLVDADTAGMGVYAKPYPLLRPVANGVACGRRVHTFKIKRQ